MMIEATIQIDFSSAKIRRNKYWLLFLDMISPMLAIDPIILGLKPVTWRNHWQGGIAESARNARPLNECSDKDNSDIKIKGT
jgi:hypothetical protein